MYAWTFSIQLASNAASASSSSRENDTLWYRPDVDRDSPADLSPLARVVPSAISPLGLGLGIFAQSDAGAASGVAALGAEIEEANGVLEAGEAFEGRDLFSAQGTFKYRNTILVQRTLAVATFG
eukprot:CAMPEP_0184492480 /NCGR_PEP_ID=MMETSP0113_2-20130426/23382_1 /TAXON_ID=91329 /ORGANISM="Norrisiella sphaerica, Strain BC52" /LENGTH=123 /DNA_ID=CAMNT_0026877303 /DNA_START=218 /DNA_END=591 /DNA_ORIENTATION=-